MPVPSVTELIAELHSLRGRERNLAVRKLGQSRDAAVIEPLRELLEQATDKNLVGLIIKTLGQLGDRRVVPDVIRRFQVADEPIRRAILRALIRLGVFNDVLPPPGRHRRMVEQGIIYAGHRVIELVERDELTVENLRRVLPPIL